MLITVPTPELSALLAARLSADPDVDVRVWGLDSPPPATVIEMVVLPYMGSLAIMDRLRGVEVGLLQSQSIGYDGVAARLGPGNVFANAASVHEASTAELAVALTLAAQRELPRYALAQRAAEWDPRRSGSLADCNVLVVGYGGVGAATAARLLPFETVVTRVASRARTLPDGTSVHGADQLPRLLPDADVVIVTVPLNDATVGLVDDRFLSAMADGALLVNVSRGQVVETDALVDHVSRGRVRAALDVTSPEPLPDDHPLWALPGVIITPHVGGATTAMMPRMAGLVERQVRLMAAGAEPQNVVLRT